MGLRHIAVFLILSTGLFAQQKPPRPCRGAGDTNCVVVAGPEGSTAPTCKKYTVSYDNAAFKVANTAATVVLFTLPQYGKILGVNVKHSAQFSDGVGAMTQVGTSVGDSSSAIAYSGSQNIGEATAVADTAFTDTTQFKSTTMAAAGRAVNAYFTATNRNFGDGNATFLTGGSVDFRVCWVNIE